MTACTGTTASSAAVKGSDESLLHARRTARVQLYVIHLFCDAADGAFRGRGLTPDLSTGRTDRLNAELKHVETSFFPSRMAKDLCPPARKTLST